MFGLLLVVAVSFMVANTSERTSWRAREKVVGSLGIPIGKTKMGADKELRVSTFCKSTTRMSLRLRELLAGGMNFGLLVRVLSPLMLCSASCFWKFKLMVTWAEAEASVEQDWKRAFERLAISVGSARVHLLRLPIGRRLVAHVTES